MLNILSIFVAKTDIDCNKQANNRETRESNPVTHKNNSCTLHESSARNKTKSLGW